MKRRILRGGQERKSREGVEEWNGMRKGRVEEREENE